MRADRLLAILMILQARGKVTATELAEELEVCERTIYRDVIALSTSGVPVYTESGPGGGISLIESYRTTLTGMKEDEVKALFMLSIPTPLTELGVSQQLKAAMLKLAAALPSTTRQAEAGARVRIHLDWQPWHQPRVPVPNLQNLHQAIWQDCKISIRYILAFDTQMERIVEPYGLVAKANDWYLIYSREEVMRVIRVSQIVAVEPLDQQFIRLADFDLEEFWQVWSSEYEQNRPTYPVRLRISKPMVEYLLRYAPDFSWDILKIGEPEDHGWVTISLDLGTHEKARNVVLSLGGAAEVLEPFALRDTVSDYASQVLARYE